LFDGTELLIWFFGDRRLIMIADNFKPKLDLPKDAATRAPDGYVCVGSATGEAPAPLEKNNMLIRPLKEAEAC